MRNDRDGRTASGLLALVFDPESASRTMVGEILRAKGLDVVEAVDEQDSIATLRSRKVDLVVARTGAPDLCGAAWLLDALREPDGPLVAPVLDGATREGASHWLAEGAVDWLALPVDPLRVAGLADRARHRSIRSSDALPLLGSSRVAKALRTRVLRLAESDEAVWVAAEHDEDAAAVVRTIHALSSRRPAGLHVLDCASRSKDPDSLASGITDALFEASGASLLLAGITEVPLESQQRLLAALQRDRSEVRLFASSSWSVRDAMRREALHEGLADLLATTSLELPRLDERWQDLPAFVGRMIDEVRRLNRLPALEVSRSFLAAVTAYSWPGGMGELRNAVEQAVVLAEGDSLGAEHLPDPVRRAAPAAGAAGDLLASSEQSFRAAKRALVERFEAAYLGQLLVRHSGNVTSAARQAGMLRSALQRLLRKHGLRSSEYRGTREARRSPDARSSRTAGPEQG